MDQNISVIIPFFQREKGILTNALKSIFSQTAVEAVREILVIDDSSPIAASTEVEALTASQQQLIRIIQQPNGGPGSARNNGLDNVSQDCEFVAFLDSDDRWLPSHLATALAALGQGGDFYFANFFQIDQEVGAFERAGKIDLSDHPLLESELGIHRYQGDFKRQIMVGNLVGTPTVVFRQSVLHPVRFDPAFFNAGEDYLFWLEVTSLTDKIVFSSQCQCSCGRGVNIFAGAEWGSSGLQDRTYYELKYKRAMVERYASDQQTLVKLQQQLQTLRRQYGLNLLSMLKRGKLTALLSLFKHFPALVGKATPAAR